MKDLEHRAGLEAEALGLQREFPGVGPENVLGIEINPYAAELARVTVWIGEIQWMRRNGFSIPRQPVLRPLSTIECRDAAMAPDGSRARWPRVDAIIGNPPFLGGKMMRSNLGHEYVERLFKAYDGLVPAEADLVAYWVAKAWKKVATGSATRAGLVTTNSIRGGASRKVVQPIAEANSLLEAWSDEPWVVEGAAVRVSLLCFERGPVKAPILNGVRVPRINPDLTASGADLTVAARLRENAGVAFMGDTKGGAFDVPGALAREWLTWPSNPNGRPNSDVLWPWVNGMDLVRRPSDKWIIDFGWEMSEVNAAYYEAPFAHLQEHVAPVRRLNRRELYARNWWRHVEPRPGMWRKLKELNRYLVTPTVAKHRIFGWMDRSVCPDHQLIVIARQDDFTLGILHSRYHEAWSVRLGTSLGVGNDPRYTPSTTFETFPFPDGMPLISTVVELGRNPASQKIANAAQRLNALRLAWLNPPELVRMVPEVVPGLPDRVIPVDGKASAILAKRTLTALYNQRPTWLANAHAELDAAVAAAYGWPEDISTDDALERLLALNLERAEATIAT